MLRRLLSCVFGGVLAQVIWYTWCETPAGDHYVGGTVSALSSPKPSDQLYLRHTFHVAERPKFAWIRVLASDRLTIYVNGQYLSEVDRDGFDTVAVINIAPYLQTGTNAIALKTQRSFPGQAPIGRRRADQIAVAVRGQYQVGSRIVEIDDSTAWRCCTVPDSGSQWWFQPEYDDHHWPNAERNKRVIRSTLPFTILT